MSVLRHSKPCAGLRVAHVNAGYLIYAAGETDPTTHTITTADKQLHVVTLQLANEPDDILNEISELATRIRNTTEPQRAVA